MKSSINHQNIKKSLSPARLSGFAKVTNSDLQALHLYRLNIQISSAFWDCLAVCEVVLRNAVHDALTAEFSENWAFNDAFLYRLPKSAQNQLLTARRKRENTLTVIAELPFFFWQSIFTARFDWLLQSHINLIFPNLKTNDLKQTRLKLSRDLEQIRTLRNRIAHHEPIFNHDLQAVFDKTMAIIAYRCLDTANWLNDWQKASHKIKMLQDENLNLG